MDKRMVREEAQRLRSRSKSTAPPFSTRRIVDECFPTAIVTGRHLPDGVNEVVSRTPDGPIIVYHRPLPVPMQRFVIAHAVGHLLFDGDDAACRPDHRGNVEIEERADWFAAELLAPLTELEPLVCQEPAESGVEREIYLDMVDELASTFAVPSWVIDWRIHELRMFGAFA